MNLENIKVGDYVAITGSRRMSAKRSKPDDDNKRILAITEVTAVTAKQFTTRGGHRYWKSSGRAVTTASLGNWAEWSTRKDYDAWMDQKRRDEARAAEQSKKLQADRSREEYVTLKQIGSEIEFEIDGMSKLPLWRIKAAKILLDRLIPDGDARLDSILTLR